MANLLSLNEPEPRRAFLELLAIGLCLVVWAFAELGGWKVPALLTLTGLWVAYFARRLFKVPGQARKWGFRIDNVRHALTVYGVTTVAAVSLAAAWRVTRGPFDFPPTAAIVVSVYPAWALAQQFVLQNLLVADAKVLGVPKWLLPVVGAAGFGMAHLPDVPLALLTATGGILWTTLFLYVPNLWVLAGAHTVVGTFAFYWVLGRDAAREFPGVFPGA